LFSGALKDPAILIKTVILSRFFYFKRMVTAFSWASRPSMAANLAACLPYRFRASSEKERTLIRFTKSYTPKGEANLAVPPVGRT